MRIEEFHKGLPQDILQSIADDRVLALGYCTSEIKKKITKISLANAQKVRAVFDAYGIERKKQNIPGRIMNDIDFHDAYVSCVEVINHGVSQDIVIDFYYGVFTDNDRIVFKNAEFITQEQEMVDRVFLYKEVYKVPLSHTSYGYEFHMLLAREEPIECTIRCSDIIVSKVKK